MNDIPQKILIEAANRGHKYYHTTLNEAHTYFFSEDYNNYDLYSHELEDFIDMNRSNPLVQFGTELVKQLHKRQKYYSYITHGWN